MKTPLFTLNQEELFGKLECVVNEVFKVKTELDVLCKRVNNVLLAISLEYNVVLTTALVRTLVDYDFASPEAKALFLSAFENALQETEVIVNEGGEVDTYSTFHQVLSNVRHFGIPRVLRNEYPILALLEDLES